MNTGGAVSSGIFVYDEARDIDLRITDKSKKKAQKRRIRGEKKWLPLRIIGNTSIVISMIVFVIGIFAIPYREEDLVNVCGVVFAILLVVGISCKALIYNLTSHWITDRLNESIWVEGDILYQFIQTAFAAGMNARNPDRKKGDLFAMDMNTIRDAKYDPKSGRIVFTCGGVATIYDDVMNNRIKKQWEMKEHHGIFYQKK